MNDYEEEREGRSELTFIGQRRMQIHNCLTKIGINMKKIWSAVNVAGYC